MPRCDTCNRMMTSSETRKLPGRHTYRCKDKFACLLAETNREAHTATLRVTFPAKNLREARQIAEEIAVGSKPCPSEVVSVTDAHGNECDVNDVRQAVLTQ